MFWWAVGIVAWVLVSLLVGVALGRLMSRASGPERDPLVDGVRIVPAGEALDDMSRLDGPREDPHA